MSERLDFGGDFKAAMSLDQSPLATSSGVSSSGWAMLQRHEDIISEDGCDGGCDNGGVHKGLVFTVIVTRSLLSILSSTFYCQVNGSWSRTQDHRNVISQQLHIDRRRDKKH